MSDNLTEYKSTEKYGSCLACKTEDEINIIDIAVMLAKHKKAIFGVPVIVSVIVAIIVGANMLYSPTIHKMTIKIFLSESSTPKEAVFSLINSKSMGDSLMSRLDLRRLYHASSEKQALSQLLDSVSASIDDNSMTITVSDPDSSRALTVINTYPKILNNIIQKFAITETGKRRLILEKQLTDLSREFKIAESKLVYAQNIQGFKAPDASILEMVKKISNLKAKIAMKELQLYAMESQSMAKYPSYLLLKDELTALWAELSEIDQDKKLYSKITLKDLEYIRLLRDFMYNEARYDQLVKQIEKTKVEELYDVPMLQVVSGIDMPNENIQKNLKMYIIFGATISFVVMVILSLLIESYKKAKNDSRNQIQIDALKKALEWK